jgi:hypothetical protein
MKDQFIDTEIPIEQGDLLDNIHTTEDKNRLAKEIIDAHRAKAEQEVRNVGGRLRTDIAPQTYIRRGADLIDGGDYLLSAMRWACVVPNAFDPKHAASRR